MNQNQTISIEQVENGWIVRPYDPEYPASHPNQADVVVHQSLEAMIDWIRHHFLVVSCPKCGKVCRRSHWMMENLNGVPIRCYGCRTVAVEREDGTVSSFVEMPEIGTPEYPAAFEVLKIVTRKIANAEDALRMLNEVPMTVGGAR